MIEVVYDDRFQVFLIHYGWRGTMGLAYPRLCVAFVSNPLRLEGNIANIMIPNLETMVSNPLRLEGNGASERTGVP